MKHPIFAYGHPVLRQKGRPVTKDDPHLPQLINDLWETMKGANGCGLAAQQIGLPLCLFIVDSLTTYEKLDATEQRALFDPSDTGIRETFINARLLTVSPETWRDEEGCLSLPGFTREVERPWSVTLQYEDADFQSKTHTFYGLTARMIQHEYDHTEGILFIDRLPPLGKRLLAAKLEQVSKGRVNVPYTMRFGREHKDRR